MFEPTSLSQSYLGPVRFVSQELDEIRKSGMKNFRNIQVDESNILTWQGLIVPVSMMMVQFHYCLVYSSYLCTFGVYCCELFNEMLVFVWIIILLNFVI